MPRDQVQQVLAFQREELRLFGRYRRCGSRPAIEQRDFAEDVAAGVLSQNDLGALVVLHEHLHRAALHDVERVAHVSEGEDGSAFVEVDDVDDLSKSLALLIVKQGKKRGFLQNSYISQHECVLLMTQIMPSYMGLRHKIMRRISVAHLASASDRRRHWLEVLARVIGGKDYQAARRPFTLALRTKVALLGECQVDDAPLA